jgi:beta-glucanase (GH16 family)
MVFDEPGWRLIFADEFEGTTLNTDVWDTCIPWLDPDYCTIEDDSELQVYLPENAYLDGNGHLMLKAQEKVVGDWWYNSQASLPFTVFSKDNEGIIPGIPAGRTVYARTTYDFVTFSPTGETVCLTPTPTPTPTPMPTPVGQTGDWTMIFSDEFDGTSLNTSIWNNNCYPDGWDDDPDPNICSCAHSNEAELYRAANAYLDGSGHLVLRAEKDTSVNPEQIYSGMVQSYSSFHFTYGFVEARFKIPSGQGLWPAFWMLPWNQGLWPEHEIDIMENLGQQPNHMYMIYHSPEVTSSNEYSGPDYSADWHFIAVDWEPRVITWYIDGVQRARYRNPTTIYNSPMFLILNLAVGDTGSWPGRYDHNTPFPSDYIIDYVRVWQQISLTKIYLPLMGKTTAENVESLLSPHDTLK